MTKRLTLSDVMLDNVKLIRDDRFKIASGTFVKVYKAYHNKTIFAAKEFLYSDTTVNRQNGFDSKGNPRTDSAALLLQECHRCKQLIHANVVRLIGLYYSSAPAIPTLIVEKLRETLNHFLGHTADIEFTCKLSILLDVAQGLMYLHSQGPPIVHGCLTSQSVFLTDLRQAKISGDFAVTSLLKKASMRKAKKCDREVIADFFPRGVKLDRCVDCDLPLDVFLYAGIVLHVLTQMWPEPNSYTSIGNISEMDRRQKYIKAIGTYDCRLQELVKCCLDDNSRVRPTIVKVLGILQNIASEEISPTPAPATNYSVNEASRQV